jgi:SET domain-containing protein
MALAAGSDNFSKTADTDHVHVGLSVIHGKGLFASSRLASGRLISNYDGETVTEDGMHVLWVEEEDGQWTGYRGDNHMRFMNHSDAPNAEMDGLQCYASQNIAAGEEITIDYGWNES